MTYDECNNIIYFLTYGREWFTRLDQFDSLDYGKNWKLMRDKDGLFHFNKNEIMHTANRFPGLTSWMVARMYNSTIAAAERILIRYELPTNRLDDFNLEARVREMSSKYFPFDGAALIYYMHHKYKIDHYKMAAVIGLSPETFHDVMLGRRYIRRDQVITLANYMKVDIDFWRRISTDVDAIMRGDIKESAPLLIYSLFNASYNDIGPWAYNKYIIARNNLITARAYNGFSIRTMSNALGLNDSSYADLEIALRQMSIDEAKKACLVLKTNYAQDLMVVNKVPINYVYRIKEAM